MLFEASALHRTGSLPVSNYTREPEQRTCQNRSMSGTFENVRIRRSHVLQVWFRTGCDEDPLVDLLAGDGMSTLPGTSDAQSFHQRAKSCAPHSASSGGTRGVADGPVRILGKGENQDAEFQKEYLSCPMIWKNS